MNYTETFHSLIYQAYSNNWEESRKKRSQDDTCRYSASLPKKKKNELNLTFDQIQGK